MIALLTAALAAGAGGAFALALAFAEAFGASALALGFGFAFAFALAFGGIEAYYIASISLGHGDNRPGIRRMFRVFRLPKLVLKQLVKLRSLFARACKLHVL